MNIQKTIAIIVAILINCAALAWFHSWSTAAAAGAAADVRNAREIVTLPVVTVHPSAAQLRELRPAASRDVSPDPSGSGSISYLVMPFYSSAGWPGGADD